MERHVEILRFTTAGSVDDGKSTLIGRLLYDSKALFAEQLEAIRRASGRRGAAALDLALVTDGLKEEQEKGITIDVGYRYFATPRRKFIIADAPGHPEFTRNMVTAASTANLAVVLVDATKGIVSQTRRHSLIASLLRVPHLVVAVNKMDLVGFAEEAFERIREEFEEFSGRLSVHDVAFIPMSALFGDNVVERSVRMPWYGGRSLLAHLEEVHVVSDGNLVDFRLPVQGRIDTAGYRAVHGSVASGVVREGDDVVVLPSGRRTRISRLESGGRPLKEAWSGMAVNAVLAEGDGVVRGDVLARPGNQPPSSHDLDAMLCWVGEAPLREGNRYLLQQMTRLVPVRVERVAYRIDPETLHRIPPGLDVQMNDIVRVQIRAEGAVIVEPYGRNRATGGFILVDEDDGATVAAGLVL